MAERLSYSYSEKISPKQYENVSISATFTSDVKHDEELDDAWERITKFVESKVQEKRDAIKAGFEPPEFG